MTLRDQHPKSLLNSIRLRKLEVIEHPVELLLARETNARTHPKKQIQQLLNSVCRFGFTVPILIDAKCVVIAGHARLEVAKRLGMERVPTISITDLTDAEVRAYAIADNKLALNADWSPAVLAKEFEFLAQESFDLDSTGFEYPEIEHIFELAQVDEETSPLDDIPEIVGPAISRPGDLWTLNKHSLFCGDSLDPQSYERLLRGEKARMVFTDPPYNVKIDGHCTGKGSVKHREFAMAAGEMSEAEFTDFQRTVMQNLVAHTVDGSIHFYCMDFRHMYETLSASRGVYTKLMNLCVWAKTNGGMGTFYRSRHELVFVFKNGAKPHINNFQLGQYGRNRTNVWEYAGMNVPTKAAREELKLHPTVKPVALVADAIKDCSKRGDIILDAFMGSGTTIIAAEATDRRAYGIELDPLYVDVIIRRWQQQTGEQAVREDGVTFDSVAQTDPVSAG